MTTPTFKNGLDPIDRYDEHYYFWYWVYLGVYITNCSMKWIVWSRIDKRNVSDPCSTNEVIMPDQILWLLERMMRT